MHRLDSKRVMSVIYNMLSTNDIPTSVGIFVENMCKEYGFDRVRSYIKIPGSFEYKHLHDVKIGEPWRILDSEQQINMDHSFYPKSGDVLDDIPGGIGEKIFEEKFIHSTNFNDLIDEMAHLGYIPDPLKSTKEALIASVRSADGNFGSFGYFIFEKYEHRAEITSGEMKEIIDLCKLCNDRIVNFETGKQMRTEEMLKIKDELTGLLILDEFTKKTENIVKDNKSVGFLYIDIDKFKYINEIWGYETGNEILRKVGEVLQEFLCINEHACRINGDKFGVSLLVDDIPRLKLRLEDLNNTFVEMQRLRFPEIKITIITGVYVSFEEVSIDIALDKANMARTLVKGSYKNVYNCYNDALESYSEREKIFEKKMIFALKNGEFQPYLQPKFNLKTGELIGAEALARWMSSDGMITPDEFITIFENNGFITKMDFAIYELVFEFIQSQYKCGCKMIPISVNVSREHLNNENFIHEFVNLMDKYQVKPNMIEIEITENIFIKDKEILKTFIEKIRNIGISVSIDDFGIAYSSLNLLNDVDVDVIKIDKSFITNLSIDNSKESKDKVIIKNVLNMIHELGIKSLFEGVENVEHITFLKEVGCVFGQGYYYDKPLPVQKFIEKYCLLEVEN